jgi:hypothetical protein
MPINSATRPAKTGGMINVSFPSTARRRHSFRGFSLEITA